MQIGFARAFCDIHCVRDAVVRGDRSIIRRLAIILGFNLRMLWPAREWPAESRGLGFQVQGFGPEF